MEAMPGLFDWINDSGRTRERTIQRHTFMRTPKELHIALKEITNHWIFTEVQSSAENDETVENFLKDIQEEAGAELYKKGYAQGVSDNIEENCAADRMVSSLDKFIENADLPQD
jgi:hypothetical protein